MHLMLDVTSFACLEDPVGRRHSAADNGSGPAAHAHRSMKVALDVTVAPLTDEGLSSILCPKCQGPITVHQPDAQLPDQLLGTCDGCGAWYVLGLMSASNEALVLHLPIHELVQRVAELS
ncbi:MAG TPA: hypothetical protein VGZ22_04405 [Isosphaeraceae bacterium]|jgi:hypothetical protein|nr:hypothetical protein [Isosphaeraceae bacterium]